MISWYVQESQGHPPMPWLDTPGWILRALNVIDHITMIERSQRAGGSGG